MEASRDHQPSAPQRFRVGDLLVDPGLQAVIRGNETIELPRRSFDLLLALVRRAPDLVTFDQLLDEVWAGRVVNRETVVHRVTLLRNALADDSRAPRYISLVRGRGYRCIADVEPIQEEPAVSRRSGTRRVVITAALVVILVLLAALLIAPRPTGLPESASDPVGSIAVLPFASISDDPADPYFADGLTEELVHLLGRVEDLRVAGRTSSFFFKGMDLPPREIGQRLGVRFLLEGSVHRRGQNRLRISAKLIRASDGAQLWSQHWDQTSGNLLNIQEAIVQSAVQGIEEEVGVRIAIPPPQPEYATTAMDAHTHRMFLEARSVLRERGSDRVAQAYRMFVEITERAPQFALGWTGLSDTVLLQLVWGEFLPPDEALAVARDAMDRALALAPESSEVHKSMGFYHWVKAEEQHLPPPDEAIAELEYAVALDPRNAEALAWLAEGLAIRGEYRRALEVNDLAISGDPLHVVARFNRLDYLAGLGLRIEAIDHGIQSLQTFPDYNWGYKQVAEQLVEAGRPGQAVLWLRQGALKARRRVLLSLFSVTYSLRLGSSAEELLPWVDRLRAERPDVADWTWRLANGDLPGALERVAATTERSESASIEHAHLILAVTLGDLETTRAIIASDYPSLVAPVQLEVDMMFVQPMYLAGPALWAATAYQQAGDEETARAIARTGLEHLARADAGRLPAHRALVRAGWYCRLSKPDEALDQILIAEQRGWIGIALSEFAPVRFEQDPVFDCLHGLPEFQAFLSRMTTASAAEVDRLRVAGL